MNKPGGKKKLAVPHPGDMVALGAAPQQLPGASLMKRPKLVGAASSSGVKTASSVRTGEVTRRFFTAEKTLGYEKVARDIDLSQLGELLATADTDELEPILCGAIKRIKELAVPDQGTLLTLLYWCRRSPAWFTRPLVRGALVSLLTVDNLHTNLLVINLITMSHREETSWPLSFLQAFLQDSLAARLWVDRPESRVFVSHLLAGVKKGAGEESLPDHFTTKREEVNTIFLEHIKEQLSIRQDNEVTVLLMSQSASAPAVRHLIVTCMEKWQNHVKCTRFSPDLVAAFCRTPPQVADEPELISHFLRVTSRFQKTKSSHFLSALAQLVKLQPSLLSVIVSHCVTAEMTVNLALPRNATNYHMLAALSPPTASSPQQAEALSCTLAKTLVPHLLAPDDRTRHMRLLLREMVRNNIRLDFAVFVQTLLKELSTDCLNPLEPDHRTGVLLALVDLICVCQLLTFQQPHSDPGKLYEPASNIQYSALEFWYQLSRRSMLSRDDFVNCLNKLLFMKKASVYTQKDNWPGEHERATLLQRAAETVTQQDTLIFILLLSLEGEVKQSDAMHVVYNLVLRNAVLAKQNYQLPPVTDTQVFESLLSLCDYRAPVEIKLPENYSPPRLAVAHLYWKAWLVLLVLCALNPDTLGAHAWAHYPTLRYFIEMAMMRQFTYPSPVSKSQKRGDDSEEKVEILQYERHLAGQEISEASSKLLTQTVLSTPLGPAREPPSQLLEQLASLSQTLNIGELFSHSTQPNYLNEVLAAASSSQCLPLVTNLVANTSDPLAVLPSDIIATYIIQCDASLPIPPSVAAGIAVAAPGSGPLLAALTGHLGSPTAKLRRRAAITLPSLLRVAGLDEALAEILERYPAERDVVLFSLISCVSVHFDIDTLSAVVRHLARSYPVFSTKAELVWVCADLLVVRPPSLAKSLLADPNLQNLLLDLFQRHMELSRDVGDQVDLSNEEKKSHLQLEWPGGESGVVKQRVLHASLLLLAAVPNSSSHGLHSLWFTETGGLLPVAYTLDTREEAEVLPDWVRVKLLQSSDPALTRLALDLTSPRQLLLLLNAAALPVASLQRICELLDRLSGDDLESSIVFAADPDDTMTSVRLQMPNHEYVLQLLAVHHRRGVTAGHLFKDMVTERAGSTSFSEKKTANVVRMEEEGRPTPVVELSTVQLTRGSSPHNVRHVVLDILARPPAPMELLNFVKLLWREHELALRHLASADLPLLPALVRLLQIHCTAGNTQAFRDQIIQRFVSIIEPHDVKPMLATIQTSRLSHILPIIPVNDPIALATLFAQLSDDVLGGLLSTPGIVPALLDLDPTHVSSCRLVPLLEAHYERSANVVFEKYVYRWRVEPSVEEALTPRRFITLADHVALQLVPDDQKQVQRDLSFLLLLCPGDDSLRGLVERSASRDSFLAALYTVEPRVQLWLGRPVRPLFTNTTLSRILRRLLTELTDVKVGEMSKKRLGEMSCLVQQFAQQHPYCLVQHFSVFASMLISFDITDRNFLSSNYRRMLITSLSITQRLVPFFSPAQDEPALTRFFELHASVLHQWPGEKQCAELISGFASLLDELSKVAVTLVLRILSGREKLLKDLLTLYSNLVPLQNLNALLVSSRPQPLLGEGLLPAALLYQPLASIDPRDVVIYHEKLEKQLSNVQLSQVLNDLDILSKSTAGKLQPFIYQFLRILSSNDNVVVINKVITLFHRYVSIYPSADIIRTLTAVVSAKPALTARLSHLLPDLCTLVPYYSGDLLQTVMSHSNSRGDSLLLALSAMNSEVVR